MRRLCSLVCAAIIVALVLAAIAAGVILTTKCVYRSFSILTHFFIHHISILNSDK